MVHVAAAAISIIFGKVAGELSLKVVNFEYVTSYSAYMHVGACI